MAMAQALPNDGVMRAADGTPLKVALARAERRERLKALTPEERRRLFEEF